MLFLTNEKNVPEAVTDFSLPVSEIAFQGKHDYLIRAAEYLQTDIQPFYANLPILSWLPTIDQLSKEERAPPSVQVYLRIFLKCLSQHERTT